MKEITASLEKDFYTKTWDRITGEGVIVFRNPKPMEYKKHSYDWYIVVALEKADKVVKDRHLLTGELLLKYRWAIREGFNHVLDPHLRNPFDHPRNRNTIEGIQSYIKKIEKASDEEMKNLREALGNTPPF